MTRPEPLDQPAGGRRAYDADAVDRYVGELQAEIAALRSRLHYAGGPVNSFDDQHRTSENAELLLGRSLARAQRHADETIADAERHARLIIADAQRRREQSGTQDGVIPESTSMTAGAADWTPAGDQPSRPGTSAQDLASGPAPGAAVLDLPIRDRIRRFSHRDDPSGL